MYMISRVLPFIALVFVIATGANAQVAQITPDAARAKALAGELVLIDIRRPDEWADTGLADIALKADMTAPGFIKTLLDIRAQNPNIPLALICRSGNRSGFLTGELYNAGMTDIIDVVEGMSGSGVGPGWIRRGLPVRTTDTPVSVDIIARQP
ncbi:MAG: rhodanese-like domain-containing protein [Rhodobacteraceae bacterium]|nr:rhodanese-like domain-containing protein [Paracoccaceae bacterium]